jgi:hypothetical protein
MTKQNTLKNTSKSPKKNIKTSEKNTNSKENFKINLNNYQALMIIKKFNSKYIEIGRRARCKCNGDRLKE